ncbi:MAG: penicillin-binding protein 2, partial [Oscillospiraceae bacterium]|nr:penicillin-binding protein 2 [Oscillospiraceae bacterium]
MGILRKQKKQKNANDKANRSILRLTYMVVFVFVSLIGYLSYFLVVQREEVINNSYNARVDSLSARVVRGKIRSNNGTVLAETFVGEEGQEIRSYPYGLLFAHAVGYTSVGKTGVEALGNFYMLTSHTNLVEQVLREFSGEKSPGDDVYTTLDVELQQTAYDALGERNGAVVVLEPDTGKILAMVSKPGFDPNEVDTLLKELTEDEESSVLLNRATQGLYPPGSIFKVVTTVEYLREHENDLSTYSYQCSGSFKLDNIKISCFNHKAHGYETYEDSVTNSCNSYFANIGVGLDLDAFGETLDGLLFGKELPIDLPSSISSYD